jgi:rod shape-determining protein MreC
MRNIFIFIRRYFNFLLFIVLQILSIVFLVKYNKTHEAAYSTIANEFTGRINTQYSKVYDYFHLKQANKELSEENARLRNLMNTSFENPDTTKQKVIDSLVRDTSGKVRKFIWLPAKVVSNSIASQTNYITLHRGEKQGVKKDMAVIGPTGVVGLVVAVSENYCRVMSLLNVNSKVSSTIPKIKLTGSVEWDGKDPQFLTLTRIPKSAKVAKGDTVVTSNFSANFPSDMLVGFVQSISAQPSSNFYTIKVKAATNFFSLQYVNLVDNVQWEEQRRLEAAPIKNQ